LSVCRRLSVTLIVVITACRVLFLDFNLLTVHLCLTIHQCYKFGENPHYAFQDIVLRMFGTQARTNRTEARALFCSL